MMVGGLLVVFLVTGAAGAYMDCGSDVPLCGLLVLESGFGSGNYLHDSPVVHGLWPETGAYGTSLCIAPSDLSDPTTVHPCYQQRGELETDLLSFETHEWDKHGVCAGVQDESDFFTQVCSLSSAPLLTLAESRNSTGSFTAMQQALMDAGYPVFDVDTYNMQFLISVCASNDGLWKIAAVGDMPQVCAGTRPPPPSTTTGPPVPPATSCEPNTHGPPCTSDADCAGVPNCLRCAHSGYCTDVPLHGLVI